MSYLTEDSIIPEKGKGSRITAKMKLFADHYMGDCKRVASKAALAAGYCKNQPKHANRAGVELLHHPHVISYIAELEEKIQQRTMVDQDFIVQEIMNIIEKTRDGESFNAQAALRGLELLAKHLGMFTDKVELTGKDGEAIKMQKVQEDAADFTSRLASLAKRAGTGGLAAVPDTGTEG